MFDVHDKSQGATCAAVILGLIAVAAILLFASLQGCGGSLPPLPCPPLCVVTHTPTVTATATPATPAPTLGASPSATATATAGVPSHTPTPTRSATSPASPTGTPPISSPTPVPTFQTTGGRAIVDLDLASFRVQRPNPDGTQLDYYAAAYLLWEMPGALRPETPALELSIRGTSDEHCLTFPCTSTALGLVARWSSNIRHDGGEPDEHRHCGEGINYRNRLPIGPGPITTVYVDWGPDGRRVSVSTNYRTWTATRGVGHPGFGVFVAGIANAPRGIGWAREPWSLQANGGTARLVMWETREPLALLSACP